MSSQHQNATKAGKRLVALRQAIEALENRLMLSATLEEGVLTISGTDLPDVITVALKSGDSSKLVVQVNQQTSEFDRASVSKLVITGGAGRDKISIENTAGNVDIAAEIWGNAGRDTIVAGVGADTIYGGIGGDFIDGRGGNDVIYGRAGSDRLIGGDGDDFMRGGSGYDLINGGTGTNDLGGGGGGAAMNSGLAGVFEPLSAVRQERDWSQPFIFNEFVDGFGPSQIRTAYQFGDLSDASFTNRGAGQTIVILDAYHAPTVWNDLAVFSSQFGLPAPTADNFQVVYASGREPVMDEGWAGEIALDVQWARAIAPDAKIVLVETDTNFWWDMVVGLQVAAEIAQASGGVVSMSLGFDEAFVDPLMADAWRGIVQSHPGATFVAASGDDGGIRSFPATLPEVLSVGGTRLPLDPDGGLMDVEEAWADGGGGISGIYNAPGWQQGIIVAQSSQWSSDSGRVGPDVAYNADPLTGMTVYNTTPSDGFTGWAAYGGTSAGAPQWAALIALANQQRLANGMRPLGQSAIQQIYEIARYDRSNSFRDIVDGAAGVNPATGGFDMATGWGTPMADRIIQNLGTRQVQFISTNLEWSAKLHRGWDNPDPFDGSILEYFGGTGTISGGQSLTMILQTGQSQWPSDVLIDSSTIAVSTLHRNSANQVYGFGTATVRALGMGTVTLNLRIEGSIGVGSDGLEHVSGKFYAIDAYGQKLTDYRQPTLSGTFEG